MGLFRCFICGGGTVPGYCDKCAHIADKWNALEKRAQNAENQLSDLQANVCGVLEKYATQILQEDKAFVEISANDIGLLWQEVGLRWVGKQITEIKEFCRHACLEACILADASNLFSRKNHYDCKTFLDKLKKLQEHLRDYHRFMGWYNDMDHHMRAEDAMKM